MAVKVAGAEVPVRLCIDELYCAVIAENDACSDFHIGDNNTSSYACPIPDFHICLTNNPMIAFTCVFLDTKHNEVSIVLVLQVKGTVVMNVLGPIPTMEPFVLGHL